MTPDQFRRIEQLYEQALNLPPDQRKAFLDDACPNETERERVIAMIEAHERDSGFLSVPAILVATQVSANPASRAGERITITAPSVPNGIGGGAGMKYGKLTDAP